MSAGKLKEKTMKKEFFGIFKSHLRIETDPELDPDPDPLVRDPRIRIRIRTIMSRIPNTGPYLFQIILILFRDPVP
jgi:hypothetical protein